MEETVACGRRVAGQRQPLIAVALIERGLHLTVIRRFSVHHGGTFVAAYG